MIHSLVPNAADTFAALESALFASRDFLATLQQRPVAIMATDDNSILPDGIGWREALAYFRARFEPLLSGSAGPRYFGYVTGGATPAALLGDWLASAYDQNVSNEAGSAAAKIERTTADAFAQLFGLNNRFRGDFVSGATQANTVAIATARQWAYQTLGIDVAEQGIAGAPAIRVLGGAPHSSISKAMAILGLGRCTLETVPCLPGRTAIDVSALAQRLMSGDGRPTLVLASAGEVNTGDFDDFASLADLCEQHRAWLHIDGAFGLFAALDPQRAPWLTGVERADSITVDLHKWLNVPYDSALIYTRHPSLQRQVFRATAAYLGDSPDPLHHTPENSRRFRALPAWFSLAAYGRVGISSWVQRHCALATRLGEGLTAFPKIELMNEVRLNIVCFALRNRDATQRDALLAQLQADGRVFMTPTVLFDRPAIRAAISNWRTNESDIEISLEAIRDALQALNL